MTAPVEAPPFSVTTTIITLAMDHPATRAILADVHQAHKLTMSGFAHLLDRYDFFTGITGGHPDHRKALNILYALGGRPNGTAMIRLQSSVPPAFTNPECAWWSDAAVTTPETVDWNIPSTGTIRYQIRGNPITRINGHRRAITNPDKQVQWWVEQAAKAGLQLHGEPDIDQPLTLSAPSKDRRKDPNKAAFTLKTLRYNGIATITNPVAYQHAITTGVGRGLAYGAGLLMTKTAR